MTTQDKKSLRCVATIEARMNSSRLPGKILRDILGKPSLERLVERVRRAKLVDEVVVATTVSKEDDIVETWANKNGISIYRGSEEDVLIRVLEAATNYKADVIVELTGDCPLLDPSLIDEVIDYYLKHDYDYVSNNKERSYPRGLDAQVFSRKVLEEVSSLTNDPADREHVSLYIYEHPERYRLATLKAPQALYGPEIRLCVDTPEDFTVVEAVYKNLYPKNPAFGVYDIMDFLQKNLGLLSLNSNIRQKPIRV